jgi:histidine triad (HIT) family protein
VSGGENVYPSEVEAALLGHPFVSGAAVVGLPDNRWGHRVAAALVVNGSVAPGEVEAWLRERIAAYKVPREWLVIDELPVTASGKVQRHRVRALFEASAGEDRMAAVARGWRPVRGERDTEAPVADCLFCKIRDGEIPSPRVAENDQAFAIRDINPRAPVHVLIIPKRHVPTAKDLSAEHGEMLAGMFALASQVAMSEGLADRGYRLAFNVGDDAGMTIWHLHLHLVGGRRLGPEG